MESQAGCGDVANPKELNTWMANELLFAALRTGIINGSCVDFLTRESATCQAAPSEAITSSKAVRLLPGAAPYVDEQKDQHHAGANPYADSDLGSGREVISPRLGNIDVVDGGHSAEFGMDDDK